MGEKKECKREKIRNKSIIFPKLKEYSKNTYLLCFIWFFHLLMSLQVRPLLVCVDTKSCFVTLHNVFLSSNWPWFRNISRASLLGRNWFDIQVLSIIPRRAFRGHARTFWFGGIGRVFLLWVQVERRWRWLGWSIFHPNCRWITDNDIILSATKSRAL